MKKILMSLATVGALSALVTGASFALFTDNATNNGNTFTAGTVSIDKEENKFTFTCTVDAQGLAPGDDGTCSGTVKYIGSLDAWLGAKISGQTGDLFDETFGAYPMTVTLGSGTVVDGYTVLGGKAAKNDTRTVTATYDFDIDADNDYQNATGSFTIEVVAVQARNNTNATEDGPTSWGN